MKRINFASLPPIHVRAWPWCAVVIQIQMRSNWGMTICVDVLSVDSAGNRPVYKKRHSFYDWGRCRSAVAAVVPLYSATFCAFLLCAFVCASVVAGICVTNSNSRPFFVCSTHTQNTIHRKVLHRFRHVMNIGASLSHTTDFFFLCFLYS